MKLSLAILLTFILISQNVFARKYKDMVAIDTLKGRVYIDIFETRWDSSDEDSIAARIKDFDEAKDECTKVGKRIITLDEWMIAASNHGQNTNYTLIGDSLYDANNELLPNIKSRFGGSEPVFNVDKIGIDAVGTVALTGNRYEWVEGPGGTPYVCGGEYETTDEDLLKISNICFKDINSVSRRGSATPRCALDDDDSNDQDQLTFSSRVPARLKKIILQNFADLSVVAPGGKKKSKVIPLNIKIDDEF